MINVLSSSIDTEISLVNVEKRDRFNSQCKHLPSPFKNIFNEILVGTRTSRIRNFHLVWIFFSFSALFNIIELDIGTLYLLLVPVLAKNKIRCSIKINDPFDMICFPS